MIDSKFYGIILIIVLFIFAFVIGIYFVNDGDMATTSKDLSGEAFMKTTGASKGEELTQGSKAIQKKEVSTT